MRRNRAMVEETIVARLVRSSSSDRYGAKLDGKMAVVIWFRWPPRQRRCVDGWEARDRNSDLAA
jgi:hypothetical protein